MNKLRTRMAAAAAATLVVSVTASTVIDQEAASAEYPPNCPAYSTGDWAANCWVGAAYQTSSDEVLAVETVINLYPITYGAGVLRDGRLTTATKNGIGSWQSDSSDLFYPLSSDGVVGKNTWHAMHDWVPIYSDTATVSGGYKYFRGGATTATTGNYLRVQTDGTNLWWVKTRDSTWVPMNSFMNSSP